MAPSRPIDRSADRCAGESTVDASTALTLEQQRQLLAIARASIAHRLDGRHPVADLGRLPEALDRPCGCFVTLRLVAAKAGADSLRGCIGTLVAERPLSEAVAYFAEQAAFHDPRFEPLSPDELDQVGIEISLLSSLTPLPVASESELLQRLRPGIDGLWLEAGSQHATYLPQVWQQLSDPRQFVDSLKRKAGLKSDSWDDGYCWSTYQVQHFSESECY